MELTTMYVAFKRFKHHGRKDYNKAFAYSYSGIRRSIERTLKLRIPQPCFLGPPLRDRGLAWSLDSSRS